MKKKLQRFVRLINIFLFKKELPEKISLYFHNIDDVTLESIKELIRIFKYQGYKFVSISEFNNHLNDDSKKLIALSFDDGFATWKNLLDFFEEHEIIVTFFINSIIFTNEEKSSYLRKIGSYKLEDLISTDDLQLLANSSHEIGAHTHNHDICKSLSIDEFKKDIELNLEIFKKFDIKPSSFAIPFGMRRYIDKNQILILKDYFKVICFGEPGMLFKQNSGLIERSPWIEDENYKFNLNNISTDTFYFNFLTKRSGLG